MFSKYLYLSVCTWIPSHQNPQLHLNLKPVENLQSCWVPLRTGMQPFWPHTARHAVQPLRVACGTWEERQKFELEQRFPNCNKMAFNHQSVENIFHWIIEMYIQQIKIHLSNTFLKISFSYKTQHSQEAQISMPPVLFEPTLSAGERSQTYALDCATKATGTHTPLIVYIMMWNMLIYEYTAEGIILYSNNIARFKKARWCSIVFIRSVSRDQMQRFANVPDTVTAQRQTLTEWLGQMYDKMLDWAVNTNWRSEWDSCTVRC